MHLGACVCGGVGCGNGGGGFGGGGRQHFISSSLTFSYLFLQFFTFFVVTGNKDGVGVMINSSHYANNGGRAPD